MTYGANIKIRYAEAQASTSSNTLDLTSSGGGTCRAYIIWATRDYTNDDGGVERATMSVGYGNITSDTTANEAAIGVACEANTTTEEADKKGAPTVNTFLLSYSGGSPITSDYSKFLTRITDGIRIESNGGGGASDWGLAYRFKALLIFGDADEIQIDVGTFTSSGSKDVETDVALDSAFTDEPELIFICSHRRSLDNTIADNWQLGQGVGHSTGGGGGATITQFGQTYFVKDAGTTRDASGYFYDTRIFASGFTPTPSLSNLELTGTDAGQFSVTTRDFAGAIDGMYMAVSFRGYIQTHAQYWAYPTSSPTISYTSAGFEPQCYLIATAAFADANKNSRVTGNLAHAFTWGGSDDTGSEGSIGCRLNNNSAGTTRSYGSATYVVNQRTHTGAVGYRASHRAFTSTGFQLDVDTTPAAARVAGVVAFEIPPQLGIATGLHSIVELGTAVAVPGTITTTATGLETIVELGTATAVIGAVTAAATGLETLVELGTATAVPGTVTAVATGLETLVELGAAAAVPGAVTASATGLETLVELGSATAVPGTITATATGLETLVEFGGATAVPGAITALATGLEAIVELGAATAVAGTITATATGLEVIVELGAATAIAAGGAQTALATGLETIIELGSATAVPGAITALATGLETLVELGAATALATNTATATGLEAIVELGVATAAVGAVTATATGLHVVVEMGTATYVVLVEGPIPRWPQGQVVQSGAVAGMVAQSGMVNSQMTQSGAVAGTTAQSGAVAGNVVQSGPVAGQVSSDA